MLSLVKEGWGLEVFMAHWLVCRLSSSRLPMVLFLSLRMGRFILFLLAYLGPDGRGGCCKLVSISDYHILLSRFMDHSVDVENSDMNEESSEAWDSSTREVILMSDRQAHEVGSEVLAGSATPAA